MLEETTCRQVDKPTVVIDANSVRSGQNILRQGLIFRSGDRLFETGHRIAANDLGLLAEAGAYELTAARVPRVAVLATGNELCPADHRPGIGQIRNSNGPLLVGLVRASHAEPLDLGIAADDRQSLEHSIRAGLTADVLILTGGVSAGTMDLVPMVLKSLNAEQVFHKVSLKPGKPIWFGRHQHGECLVFGLPGNPVSSFVCFHLFVRAGPKSLVSEKATSAGNPFQPAGLFRARLVKEHQIRGDRPTYWPSRLRIEDGQSIVEPLDWRGSADQRCLRDANCLAIFPTGNTTYAAGELVEFFAI
jgi:molybdopterin molybdotransferase